MRLFLSNLSARSARLCLRATFVLAALIAWLVPADGRAESVDTHRIVAEIAEQFLAPRTAEHVQALLALDNEASLASIATWADEIGEQRRATARWHYVYIPLSAVAYDPARDCGGGACVVMKLEQYMAVLRDKAAAPHDRLEALKFVVGFICDIHQPLHAADNGDRGGTRLAIIFDGRRMTLRQLWDDEILSDAGDDRTVAIDLASSVSSNDRRAWQSGSAADWANESHALAKGFVYRYLPRNGDLPSSYQSGAELLELDRLKHAGVRLAWILNRSL
jgi:nuclease S1